MRSAALVLRIVGNATHGHAKNGCLVLEVLNRVGQVSIVLYC